MEKLLIDTDIGDDVDDALALTYVIKSKKADLIGITTTFKNTHLRARQAKKLLGFCGAAEVPVYAGVGNPMCGEQNTGEIFCQYTPDLENKEFDYENMEDEEGLSATDFIIEQAEKYGQELTLLLIGPVTNIAYAIKKNPEAMRKIGRIVVMGGAFYEHFLEWNILCDPDAARILFDSEIPLYCVGIDVTAKCELTDDEVALFKENADDGLYGYINQLVNMWIKASGRMPILHDPLAAHAVFGGEFLSFEQRTVRVELDGEFTRGMTVNVENCCKYGPKLSKHYPIHIAKSVDEKAFKKLFFETFFCDAQNR